jgi:hypothetical protein
MQKPQSRGDATIAMNCWLEILGSGAEPPIELEQALATILSSAVRDLMSQSGIRFKDRGVHRPGAAGEPYL